MRSTEWLALASAVADLARLDLQHRQRGALFVTDEVAAAFGYEDGLPTGRGQRALALLRHALDEAGLDELGFGVSRDGTSWASGSGRSTWPRSTDRFIPGGGRLGGVAGGGSVSLTGRRWTPCSFICKEAQQMQGPFCWSLVCHVTTAAVALVGTVKVVCDADSTGR